MDRRSAVRTIGRAAMVGGLLGELLRIPFARAEGVDVNAVLHDPEAPESGNPRGDITIVAFFDYNCPYCKASEPALEEVVSQDAKIRLVYKDWPILSEASVFGAQMALGSRYQGRYLAVHHALMALVGKSSKEQMKAAVASAGVNMSALQADLTKHADAVSALLRRNLAQADSMGLMGTPVYLIGRFKVAQALNADGFRRMVADARAKEAR